MPSDTRDPGTRGLPGLDSAEWERPTAKCLKVVGVRSLPQGHNIDEVGIQIQIHLTLIPYFYKLKFFRKGLGQAKPFSPEPDCSLWGHHRFPRGHRGERPRTQGLWRDLPSLSALVSHTARAKNKNSHSSKLQLRMYRNCLRKSTTLAASDGVCLILLHFGKLRQDCKFKSYLGNLVRMCLKIKK